MYKNNANNLGTFDKKNENSGSVSSENLDVKLRNIQPRPSSLFA